MQHIREKVAWTIAVALALFVVASIVGVVSGGPLDPPGPLGPTQKTLDEIPPVWSQVLASNDGPDTCHSSRFLCVMPGDVAVLDRETGLVWERIPSAAATSSWGNALVTCQSLKLGGRSGWRMAGVEELMSLLGGGMPGHPFTVTTSTYYWSATTAGDAPTLARAASTTNPDTASGGTTGIAKTDATRLRWCVRGGTAADGQ